MGKKKRNHPDVEEILARPWCYYCERDFDDLKILINHQKAKHFKCERCGRRLNTAGGLNVHMTQVHKETLTKVENALENRAGLDYEIFGMEGVPEDVVQAHNQRVLQQFYEQQAERRAATGNPPPGSGANNAGNNASKKPKFESPGDIKARLAAFKAKKAADATGASSGDVTPVTAQSPAAFQQAGSPGYPQPPMPYSASQGSPAQAAYAQPYGQTAYPAQSSSFPQQPPYAQQSPFPQQPGYGASPFQAPGAAPFSPPGQQYPQSTGAPYQAPFQSGPPRQPGSGSPSAPYPYGAHQPPPSRTPPNNGQGPQRQGSLPAAPGLPQRPAFGAPQVNAFQMQQMHQGHVPSPANGPPGGFANGPSAQANGQGQPLAQPQGQEAIPGLEASVDELISSAGKQAAAPKDEAADAAEKKKEAKKEKSINLVYSDNDVSPEEKMAKLPRYAFDPAERIKDERVVGTIEPAVTGITTGPGDVIDRME